MGAPPFARSLREGWGYEKADGKCSGVAALLKTPGRYLGKPKIINLQSKLVNFRVHPHPFLYSNTTPLLLRQDGPLKSFNLVRQFLLVLRRFSVLFLHVLGVFLFLCG
jgi:hypothetical protein